MALTEEGHLRKVNGENDKYSETIRHRFIPDVSYLILIFHQQQQDGPQATNWEIVRQ
jgi:hypothetical protein